MDLNQLRSSPIGHLTPINGADGRTGRAYNHVAFVPEPLGAQPAITSQTLRAVTRATLELGRLDAASLQIPNPALLRRPWLRKEAQSTSALEGTFAPLLKVLAEDQEAEERSDPSGMAALQEVLNYVKAAGAAYDWLERGLGITAGMLTEAQGILVQGTPAEARDPGRVRTVQVAIGGEDVSIAQARFVPMPPGVELGAAFEDLVQWISAQDPERDPVVAAGMAHYQFETLHAFCDGNGRIGRLLIVLQLMAGQILREPLLSVSPWFEARRTEYQTHLFNVSATGDWDAWLTFFADGLAASATDTRTRVEQLLALQQDYQKRLRDQRVRGHVVREIASSLIGYPNLTVPAVSRRLGGVTPQAVAKAVSQLVDLGILHKYERTYRHLYVAHEVLTILMD